MNAPGSCGLGLVHYCHNRLRDHRMRNDKGDDLFEALAYLEYCHSLGAGGMQCSLKTLPEQRAERVASYAAENHLYVEGIVTLPKDETDRDRFEAEVMTAKRCGASVVRTTLIDGRRYEAFDSMSRYRQAIEQGEKRLLLGLRVAEKHAMGIALENHKDQQDGDRIRLLERIQSPVLGVCVDTGNSIALLENSIETIKAFAPWAMAVHLKDQAIMEYEEGFLLADVPLGQGNLDLQQMVNLLREAKPKLRFSLELITRDALRVPCLTEKYWNTMSGTSSEALASTLRWIRAKPKQGQDIKSMSAAVALETEAENVRQSIAFARQSLGLESSA
jgi:3-oxoisoapionate decarboxylase